MSIDTEKRLAAEAAAQLVKDGMTIGLGTASTGAFPLPTLVRRLLHLNCVAPSPGTEEAAGQLILTIEAFDHIDRFE